MQLPTTRKITLCLWTLPLSGCLAIAALFLRKFISLPGADLAEWANTVTSGIYVNAQYLYILAYVVPFFGFWALYMLLAQQHMERLAFWGLMGTLLGTALPLTTLGVFAYASPAIGKLYLQGESHLPQVITEIAMGPSMVMGVPGAFLYVTGCIFFGIAIWKSKSLANMAGVFLALHGLLISFGFGSPPLLTLSWISLIVGGIWLILSMKSTPT